MKNRHLYKLFLAFAFLLSAVQSYAQLGNGTISTNGNDFWVTFMDNKGTSPDDRSLELTIYIVADTAVDVTVDIAGGAQKRIQITNLNGGVDSVYFAMDGEYMPQPVYAYANGKQAQEAEMVLNKSVHIHNTDLTDDRVFSCSAFNKAGDPGFVSQDAALLFPSPALGLEYVVQTYETDSKSTQFVVVATKDGTNVTVHPSVATAKGTTGGGTLTKTLNKGQSLFVTSELRSNTSESIDLSGSLICSDKPVAVFVGNQGPKIPLTDAYSEGYMFEQILPLQNLGTEFYFALPKDTKQNRYSIVAAYPNTTVTYIRNVDGVAKTATLNTGDVLNNGGVLNSTANLTNVYVTADKPVLAMQYLTSGAVNQIEDFDPETYATVTNNMGNPANALIPAWEHRTQRAHFVTRKMTPKDATAKQEHFVAVITPTAEVGLLQMKANDGTVVSINAADFNPFTGNAAMSYGSILLPDGKQYFDITTSGEGFVGFVYGLTDGIGYQYVLDFNPIPYRDSLYITEENNFMSARSYDLPRHPQGWYQRQLDEWPIGAERLDTADVCDSTELHFRTEIFAQMPYDSVIWKVFKCDKQGAPLQAVDEYVSLTPAADVQEWQHRFILDTQSDREAEERDPFTIYQLQAHLVHKRVLCSDMPPIHDTLKTAIRVHRIYNDTLRKRIICVGDSIRYFYDDATHTQTRGTGLDSTLFVYADGAVTGDFVQTYQLGYNVYKREYVTTFGCDSNVTFELFVCEPVKLSWDTTVCENEPLTFPGSQFFQGTVFDHEGVYRDTIKTQGCSREYGALYDPEHVFKGCDSIWEINVHICDTFMIMSRDTFCSNGDWSVPYQWRRDGRTQTDSLVREIYFTEANADQWLEFRDTVKTTTCSLCDKGGCDSIFVLNVYIAPPYNASYTDRFCGQHYDDATTSLVDNTYSWDLCTSEYVWDSNNGCRILKSAIQNMTPGTTNTFIDSLISRHGCDSVTSLTLTRDRAYFFPEQQRMTDNQTYTWTGHRGDMVIGPLPMRNEPYIYYDSLQTDNGCDSVYRLEVRVASTFEATQIVRVCDDSLFVWEKHISADKYDPLSANGRLLWDRTHGVYVRSSADFGLESQNTEGEWESLAVGYYELVDSMQMWTMVEGNPILADSVWILKFTKNPTYTTAESFKMCDNDTMTWQGRLYVGSQFKGELAGTPYKTVANGMYEDSILYPTDCACDSAFFLTLNVYKSFYQKQELSICQDEPFEWVNHQGHTIVNEHDEIIDITHISDNVGTYHLFDRLFNPECPDCEPGKAGCDSVYELTLTVNPSYHDGREVVVDTIICRTMLPFEWTGHNMTFVCDTMVYDTLKSNYCLCDSVVQLRLTILNDTNRATTHYMCQNDAPYFYAPHGQAYDPDTISVGRHTYVRELEVGTAPHNCTYFDTLYLIVSPIYDIQWVDTICQNAETPYEWGDREGRMVYDKQQHKRIQPTAISAAEVGTFFFVDSTLTTACPECQPLGGCDSVMTLRLVVLPSYRTEEAYQMSQEEVYTWEGITYGGVKATAAHDVTVTKDTTIVWQHSTAQSGTHTCDSIRILNLQIGQVYRDTLRVTHCANEPFVWYGNDRDGSQFVRQTILPEQWTGVTEYAAQDVYKTVLNFDSIYYLELTIMESYAVTAERTYVDSICQGSAYIWTASAGRPLYLTGTKTWINDLASFTSTLPVGTYVFHDSIKTLSSSCDSVWALQLRVDSIYDMYEQKTLCENDTISWEHRLYVGAKFEGTYEAADYHQVITSLSAQPAFVDDTTYHTIHGCDSTRNLTLRVLPAYLQAVDTTYEHICDNESYAFYHGRTYNTAGEWVTATHQREDYTIGRFVLTDTILSSLDCDSAVAHVVYVHPTYWNATYDTICQTSDMPAGDYIYTDSLHTAVWGCDSVEVLYRHVAPSYAFYATPTISNEDSLHWQGHVLVGALFAGDTTGTNATVLTDEYTSFEEHYPAYYNAGGYCDSAYYLTVRIGYVFRDTTYDYVCDECTYDWTCPTQDGHSQVIKVQGDTISSEFVYKYDSLLTDLGFDSIYVLKLYRKPTYHFTLKDTICQFSDYVWNTHEGHTLYDANRAMRTTLIRTDEVGTYIFKDSLLTQTTFMDPHGVNTRTTACDSVWTLELFVPETPTYVDSLVVCDNDTVRWHNRLYMGATFVDSLVARQMYADHEVDTVITWEAGWLNDSIYSETEYGCLITYALALDVRAHDETRLYHAIGDNDSVWVFQPTGGNPANWHTAAEFHVTDYTDPTREDRHFLFCDTLTNINGCDSIVYDSVDVFPTYLFHEYDTTCSNVSYSWRTEYSSKFIEINSLGSKTYYDTCYTTAHHQDSVFALHLNVLPSYRKKTIQQLCKNDTLDWHGEKIFFDQGEDETATTIEYQQNFYRKTGCDSIFIMTATYYDYYNFFDTVTLCPTDTIDWHGQRINLAGVYWDSLQTVGCHCDSVYRLQVYNYPYYSFHQTDTICQDTVSGEYVWYNEFGDLVPVHITLQDSGWASYSYTYPTAAHSCDSTFNIRLYVAPLFRADSLYTICDNESVTWQGRTYTGDKAGGTYAAGWYRDTISFKNTALGPIHACDSTYVLQLQVLPTDYVEWYDTICAGDSMLFCGYYVSEPITYQDTVPNRHGCDSVCVLHLALRYIERVTIDTTVCVGDVYDFHGSLLTSAGTYIDTTLSDKGCLLETTLYLHHRNPTVVHAAVDRVCADTSFYNVYYTFDGMRPKTYTILYDDSAHSHRFVDVVDAELTDSVLVVPMPDHDSKADYTRPDYYRATIFFGGVCLNDSLVMESYEFLVRYPSWVIEQHWNDAIGILTASENGGYVFDAYQWFRDGQLLAGETSYYYFQPHYLIDQAQYGVYLTRQGERLAIPTCEITAQVGKDDPLMPENNYVNVVPTAVSRQHPVVNILSPVPGSYTIIDSFGKIWKTGRYTPDTHNAFEVRIPAINGVYLFQLQADEGEKQVVKVLVQ